MGAISLIARRDYFAYIGAWGFWASLLLAPLILAALTVGPLFLSRTEPPRLLAILAERPSDAALAAQAFADDARDRFWRDISSYLDTAAPSQKQATLAAFDAAPDRRAAIAAARAVIERRAPQALSNFPAPSPRYLVVPAPSSNISDLRGYLDGQRTLPDGRALYGAINIRRTATGPAIEYWSANLSHQEPLAIVREAVRTAMRREVLAQHGVDRAESDRLDALEPQTQQFDPRPSAPQGRITLRQRAPFYAAILLSFILWSVVFSTANMLLNGVIEEKSNKILDTLLTSVTPLELLVGKLLGVAAVSATLFLVWGALGGVLLNAAALRMGDSMLGQVAAGFLDPRLLAAFLIGFVAGYLIYGAIFLAFGALCESIQEAQTALGVATLIMALPMMLIAPALDNPNAPLIEAASWVPLFTPFMLLMRAPAGLGWAEIVGMGALMFGFAALVLWLASRVFHAGVVDQMSLARRKT
ncbi:MAG: ABC transporter permease [Proteobacteria bacterium]|nr:ABC transporter permease [Pseudomonadota bacterium]